MKDALGAHLELEGLTTPGRIKVTLSYEEFIGVILEVIGSKDYLSDACNLLHSMGKKGSSS